MSRNFELLQLAGCEQKYFSAAEQRTKTESANGTVGNRRRANEGLNLVGSLGTSRDEVAKLVERVFLAPKLKAPRVVVFSGVERSSGSGWVCARASRILAKQAIERVCAVDTNFHAPCLHQYFREQNLGGLADAIYHSRPAMNFAKQLAGSNLWLLAAGNKSSNGADLSSGAMFETRLRELRSEFGYVLVDAPPVNGSAEAINSCQMADGIILVMDSSGTPRGAALKARNIVGSTSVPLLGVVLNHRPDSLPGILSRILK